MGRFALYKIYHQNIYSLMQFTRLRLFLVLTLCMALGVPSLSDRGPSPYCRSSPLVALNPLLINSTTRFDLEKVFDGYNLSFTAPSQPHISVTPKYTVHERPLNQSYNFVAAKVMANNRFYGLTKTSENSSSQLVLGYNYEFSGVAISRVVHLQDDPHVHCFDVDEVTINQYAVVDCGEFENGELTKNLFMYVNIYTGSKLIGTPTSDAFVRYHHLTERHIDVIEDPKTSHIYLIRVHVRDGVDSPHANQTFIELYMFKPYGEENTPQLIDVIDHTTFGLKGLEIADYHVKDNRIYVLVYNHGLYELEITSSQRLKIVGSFAIKQDFSKFSVDTIGFNDEVLLVMANGNQVYKYLWTGGNQPPTLVQKYGLIRGSVVEQIVCNDQFVVVTAKAMYNNTYDRKHWIFSERSSSFANAYSAYDAPINGPAIMEWRGNENFLQLFHEYNTYNILFSLPYLQLNPVDSSMVNKNESITVTATSSEGSQANMKTCSENFTFTYQYPNDTTIIPTGLQVGSRNRTVDSPDELVIPLRYQFYGENLDYEVDFELGNESSLVPYTYIDKIHKAIFNHVDGVKPSDIVFYEMFTEEISYDVPPDGVLGLIQVRHKKLKATSNATSNADEFEYITHYISCDINVFDRDKTHHLNCHIVSSSKFDLGVITHASQMFDPQERRIALVFDSMPNTVMIYFFWEAGFGFYGRKDYAGDAFSLLTGVSILDGKLYCTLEYGKRIEVFELEDLKEQSDEPVNATARLVIDKSVVSFYGISYFAPVETVVSRYHDETLFVKTKTGVVAMVVNNEYQVEVLFTIPATNIEYDFEVNEDTLLITRKYESNTQIYHLYLPLRRTKQPFVRETFPNSKFALNEMQYLTSDRLFYLIGAQNNEVFVINPYFTNTKALYSIIALEDQMDLILNIDSVNIRGREILFIHTLSDVHAYVIREEPIMYVEWPARQADFNLSVRAVNTHHNNTEPYKYTFAVLDKLNETAIKPTDHFDQDQIRKLGHVETRENEHKKFTFNVTMNDTYWFEGSVFDYQIECDSCGEGKPINVQNHVEEVQELVVGRAIYDMESTHNGIYGQQYDTWFKTHRHNDSIEYIQKIPTQADGEVCSKIALSNTDQYVISLCETGNPERQWVNAYITVMISEKPFILGPYATEARKVTHAKIVDDILMIVDVEEDPLVRQGGIYLYSLDLNDEETGVAELDLIDYIDHEDMNIEGQEHQTAVGGYVASADLHDAYSHEHGEYRLFITDAQTGNLFIMSFELSPSGNEIVYLSKKLLAVQPYLPEHVRAPSPLRLMNVNIHYHLTNHSTHAVRYYLLITCANWHHLELVVDIQQDDSIEHVHLLRFFERVPWKLKNYFRFRRDFNKSQFAVPYLEVQDHKQVVAVYEADFAVVIDEDTALPMSEWVDLPSLVHVPFIRVLGVHQVDTIFPVEFAFHNKYIDTLLFTDIDGENITELAIYQNVTLVVKDLEEPIDVTITARNPYDSVTFTVEVQYIDEDEEEKIEIIWIIIVAIGGFMIIGLITVYAKQKSQSKKKPHNKNLYVQSKSGLMVGANVSQKSRTTEKKPMDENKESLLSSEDRHEDLNMNRTSVDSESVRDTIDLRFSANPQERAAE